jgi:ABC-2 type transport system ATP-binding protein
MITVENLTKTFKKQIPQFWLKSLFRPKFEDFKAVDSISFEIKKGEIFGLLGPNGAGKTTTIRMLCGIEYPSGGTIHIDGLELQSHYRQICEKFNVLFSDKLLYNRLTAYDNLLFYANMYSIGDPEKRANELLDFMNLMPWKDQYVENFSLGMRMKVALARALVNDPEILYLDEPTLGLDVKNAETIRTYLKSLNRTILMTTHYLNEAIVMCSRIGILQHGKLVYIDTPDNLKRLYSENRIFLIDTNDNQAAKKILAKNPYVKTIEERNTKLEVHLNKCENYFDILNDINHLKLIEFQEMNTGLEGLFFDVTDEAEKTNQ